MAIKHKTLKEFQPGHGYTKEDWDAVDSPELTDEELAKMRPFKEVFPDLAESIHRSRGRPKVEEPKEAVTLRLDPEVVSRFKKRGGRTWRAKMNEVLRKAVGL